MDESSRPDSQERHGPSAADRRAFYPFHILRLMWREHPWVVVATVMSGMLAGVTSMAIIDTINGAIHQTDDPRQVLPLFVGLCIANAILHSLTVMLPIYAALRITNALRVALCRKVLVTPLEEIDERGTANVLTLLTNDVQQLCDVLSHLPKVMTDVMILTFALAYLAHLSWAAFASALCAIVTGLFIHGFFVRGAMRFGRKYRSELTACNEHACNLVGGIKELKLNEERRRWFRRAGIDLTSRKMAHYGFIRALWFAGGTSTFDLASHALTGFIVFVAGSYWIGDPGVLTASVLTAVFMAGPLGFLINIVPELGMASIACERLAEFGFSITTAERRLLLEEGPSATERDVERRSWQAVTLRGVKVRYSNDRGRDGFELGPIDLELQPSELLFIVGGNGSGKSTLAKTLTGLYRPVEGEVLLDGRPVREEERDVYSSLFSAVFSDFHVFDYVVGAGEARADVGARGREHLERFGLADKVTIARRRLSTTTALSHGQRKRLALLSAYLEDRPIYVLDEWAADQDPVFKRFFYEVLLPELKSRGKCVVVITHDDHYFRWADRVLKLQDGRMLSVTEARSVA